MNSSEKKDNALNISTDEMGLTSNLKAVFESKESKKDICIRGKKAGTFMALYNHYTAPETNKSSSVLELPRRKIA